MASHTKRQHRHNNRFENAHTIKAEGTEFMSTLSVYIQTEWGWFPSNRINEHKSIATCTHKAIQSMHVHIYYYIQHSSHTHNTWKWCQIKIESLFIFFLSFFPSFRSFVRFGRYIRTVRSVGRQFVWKLCVHSKQNPERTHNMANGVRFGFVIVISRITFHLTTHTHPYMHTYRDTDTLGCTYTCTLIQSLTHSLTHARTHSPDTRQSEAKIHAFIQKHTACLLACLLTCFTHTLGSQQKSVFGSAIGWCSMILPFGCVYVCAICNL